MNIQTPNSPSSDRLARISASQAIPDSEWTVFDFVMMLVRYKWIVFLVTLVGAGCGLALALYVPRVYTLSSIIEVGTFEREATTIIEAPESVISKISTVYMPVIERQHGKEIGIPAFSLGLELKNPRGTNLVVLTNRLTEGQEAEHVTLHGLVTERVLNDHKAKFQLLHTTLELELEQARRVAASLKDKAQAITVRRNLMQEKRNLTTQRLQLIDSELAGIEANRNTAGKSLSSQDQVLTVMMLDLQLARERDKQAELQRAMAIGMAEESDQLTREEADLQRSQQDQDGRIVGIQARISHVAETRLVGQPQRSQKPVGIGRSTIAIGGLIMGLGIGILLASMLQSMQKHKARVKTLVS
jgi:hypothetical protein